MKRQIATSKLLKSGIVFLGTTLTWLAGCAPGGVRYPRDDLLGLEDVQAKGTHNSYHVAPDDPVDESHRYTHVPLGVQLAEQGVRQFELDVHLRAGEGFEVFHLPAGVDQGSTCRRLVDCLGGIKDWSDRHPDHVPIVIWLEPKDEDLDWIDETLLPIEGHYGELEAAILSVWPAERILQPDEVRGGYATLPEAIAAGGWPRLGALRGKVVFALLDSATHREAYTRDAPALQGKLLFVDASEAADPYAAMFKIDDARADGGRIRELVEAGFVVTCNADGAGATDRDNQARLEASLASGANFISTDFPAPVDDRAYWFDLPAGTPARCNPHTTKTCTSADIESLR